MSCKNNLVTDDKDMIFQDLLSHKNKGLIYMVYQPQYDFNSGELVGVEALLRYKSNKLGLISPTKIVEIFEEKLEELNVTLPGIIYDNDDEDSRIKSKVRKELISEIEDFVCANKKTLFNKIA